MEHKNVFFDKAERMYVDNVERTVEYLKVVKLAEEEVYKKLEADGFAKKFGSNGEYDLIMGGCHMFWSEKKDLLKEKYNIDWRSPTELNEDFLFD